MDAHDDWTELFEQLKSFKGQFSLNAHGEVRHKTQTAIAPDWVVGAYSGPEMACPLNSLCQQYLADRGERVSVLENGDFKDMATILGMPQEYVERFASAADGEQIDPGNSLLRQRLIETVC
jgi:hypothetical protein